MEKDDKCNKNLIKSDDYEMKSIFHLNKFSIKECVPNITITP